MNINTSLLREKFIIKEKNISSAEKPLELYCPSTRMSITLQAHERYPETLIIRTHNMHSCVRMVAKIIDESDNEATITKGLTKSDWGNMWRNSINAYDEEYNPNSWVAIYSKGSLVFSSGKYHQLFDVIEKCDAINNNGSYEDSVEQAADYFARAGKEVDMMYDSNVALVAALNNNSSRCSMILRGAGNGLGKATTFNYSLEPTKHNQELNIPLILCAAADFLEGVQLSYMIGISNEELSQGLISQYSDKNSQAAKALERIELLDKRINRMESRYNVHYRPERPNFSLIISQSEEIAKNNI